MGGSFGLLLLINGLPLIARLVRYLSPFEKAQFGDMDQFMDSDQGKGLHVEERLKLCANIGKAIMAMHSCHVIHGDIKPSNILIFKDDTESFFPKLADFGYSTLVARDELIDLPKSIPWYAPEHHHRGFKFSAAQKMDTYSFGMLCLRLIFREKLDDIMPHAFEGKNGFAFPILQVKDKDELPAFTRDLITVTTTISGVA